MNLDQAIYFLNSFIDLEERKRKKMDRETKAELLDLLTTIKTSKLVGVGLPVNGYQANLILNKEKIDSLYSKVINDLKESEPKKIKVYLSGGMHSGWQDWFIKRYPHIEFLDPRSHGFTAPELYSEWDNNAIDECDLLIAYLENDNPSGVGLAYEIGRALGQGKHAFLIEDTNSYWNEDRRYFELVRHSVTMKFIGNFERMDLLGEAYFDMYFNQI